MTTSGIRRKVDDLGRVVIPASIRKALGVNEGETVEVLVEGDSVMIRRAADTCTFCSSEDHLDVFRGKAVCWSCMAALRAKARSNGAGQGVST